MMRVACWTLALFLMAMAAEAVPCVADDVPAATLLLPYFEVDLDDPESVTTLLSINNSSAAPVLVHLTLWTDLSVPTIDFDLYLSGYDVQSLNLRDVFAGVLPQTGPADELSPLGAFSDPHAVPESCSGGFPIGNVPPSLVRLLEEAHTGQPVARFGGLCAGTAQGDRLARGYLTADVVRECSTDFPDTPGYFENVAGFDNVLWGDFFLIDSRQGFAHGETLVHVEANPGQYLPGDYTFYGSSVAFTAADQREPLASVMAMRFLNGGPFDGGTDLLCWRDPKTAGTPFDCGNLPAPLPLGQGQVVIFDESSNPALVPESRISPSDEPETPAICPFCAQRREVDFTDFASGWLYLDLNHSLAFGEPVGGVGQAWVTPLVSAEDRYTVGFDALSLVHACDGLPTAAPGD
ncbi:MAG: hypothetical protein AAF604_24135 [Acidobacteriota bacterium]